MPLCADGRELILVEFADGDELTERTAELESTRRELVASGIEARTVCFTSTAPEADLVRLAAEQEAELLVVSGLAAPHDSPCDVAAAPRSDLRFASAGPVLVPFGGGREEWPALELGAWLARAHVLVTSLPSGDLDPTRSALVERTTVPLLLVRAGLRPGGLAPEHTLTRFSWSLDESA